MTTKCVQTALLKLLITLASFILLANVVLAQGNTPEASAEIATTSVEASVPVVVEAAPWFQVEQLIGDNQAVGDFVVGPGRAEIEVLPGQTVTYEISISNRISDGRTFELSVEDVAGSADGSQAVVLLGESRGPYTVKDYISFPSNTFKLDLGERARIPVTISIPPDAEPGGFYGSVLVSTLKEEEEIAANAISRSPIIARIGTLFFITVPGEVQRSGQVKDLSLLNDQWWYESGPISLAVTYENTGSVHLNPYGELRIKNFFKEEVGFLELEPWFALPKSLRSREVRWDREFLFGRYVATVYINRGYDDVVDEKSIVFWVLPWKIVGGIFLIVFLFVFSIRAFFKNFEFKRKT